MSYIFKFCCCDGTLFTTVDEIAHDENSEDDNHAGAGCDAGFCGGG